MTPKLVLPADVVRQLLDYDPETGILRWRARRLVWFSAGAQSAEHSCNIWNGRFAGKRAGSIAVRGNRTISINHTRYAEHRIVWLYMTGEFPAATIDHVNLDATDNRWNNLREATIAENGANKRGKPNRRHRLPKGVHPYWTRHGCKGVPFVHPTKFRVSISVANKQIHLGLFCSVAEAKRAYDIGAKTYHGEFARLS